MTAVDVSEENAAGSISGNAPKLSARDWQIYNHMSVHMNRYHDHFRQQWRILWEACSQDQSSKPLTASVLINTGLSLISHLTLHHDIEERYIFSYLAERMPEFRPNAPHLEQHKQIHKGMDELEEYLNQCREGSRDFRREEVRECMQKWGDVLWTHLDEEVATLAAPNMRKYWTIEEMQSMPIVAMSSDSQLYDDTFTVIGIESGKYERVSRLQTESLSRDTEMSLDINKELFDVEVGNELQVVLASTLNLDGTKDDSKGWKEFTRSGEQSLADMYDYVCRGKIYRFDTETEGQLRIYVSFGGLLMDIRGPFKKLTSLRVDHVFLLVKK
ncbi:MAG: hypothetical protein Q9162_007176 [Coniocarpon cinnabarinum]